MRSIIIEDEKQSAEHLNSLLKGGFPEIEIVAKLRSVEEAISWFSTNKEPELIFIDIELSDGTCFEILEDIQPRSKLIFTTAYDQHALKAFEYNSIAYLLKPISKDKLREALNKLEGLNKEKFGEVLLSEFRQILKHEYKKRFLVKRGEKYWPVMLDEIAYFVSEDGLAIAYLFNGKKHFIDFTLDSLEKMIDPVDFFRINRKMMINIKSIVTVKTYFSRRLLLELEPSLQEDIIVSKERAANFKSWLNT